MTNHQIQLVQSSFKLIEQDLESAAMMFYDRMFQLDPSLRHMFRNTREEQAQKLSRVLRIVVNALSRIEQILPTVEELGRKHANYGVRQEHYASGGAALLWTLKAGLEDRFTPDVRDAWTSAYLFLSSTMQKAAADAETTDIFATAQHA